VEQDGADLVEEGPGGHEVAGLHDDRRQDDGEEDLRVEDDQLPAVGGEVHDDAEDDSDQDQQARLGEVLLERLARVER